MNASRSQEPHPRYVFLTGRMDPHESVIVLSFGTEEVFPREKTIRLELVEFDLCSVRAHPHFGAQANVNFPPSDVPYQPFVQVRRPAPLPATKRRRTNYYLPVMTKTWLPPSRHRGSGKPPQSSAGETLEPEDSDQDEGPPPAKKRKKSTKRKDPQIPPAVVEEEEGEEGYETVEETETVGEPDEEPERDEDALNALMINFVDEFWFAPDESAEMDGSRSRGGGRYRRAVFKDSKVTLDIEFKMPGGKSAILAGRSIANASFAKTVQQLNDTLAGIEGRVFCNLHEHPPPIFSFADEAGNTLADVGRQKARIKVTIPPRTSVYFEEGAVWKLLGFSDASVVTPYSRKGPHAKRIKNSHESDSQEYVGTAQLVPTGYLTTAKGLSTEEWEQVEDIRVGLISDLFKVSLCWETDHTVLSQLSPQARPPNSKTARLILNKMVSVGLEALLLKNHAVRFLEAGDENRLTCPAAELTKPDPSPVSPEYANVFTLSLTFGPEAAKAMGLNPQASPISIVGGLPFAGIGNAFLRQGKDFDSELDGGGLTWENYNKYLTQVLILDAQDEVNDLNAQLDHLKRKARSLGPCDEPSWAVKAQPANQPETPAAQDPPPEASPDEREVRTQVLEEIARDGGVPSTPPPEAVDIGDEVVREQDEGLNQTTTPAVDPTYNQPDPLEQEAQRLYAEQEAEKKRLLQEAELEAENERLRQEAEQKRLQQEAEQKKLQQQEAEREAEKERLQQEAEQKKLQQQEAEREAEKERLQQEAEQKRLQLQQQQEAERKAEKERLQQEAEKIKPDPPPVPAAGGPPNPEVGEDDVEPPPPEGADEAANAERARTPEEDEGRQPPAAPADIDPAPPAKDDPVEAEPRKPAKTEAAENLPVDEEDEAAHPAPKPETDEEQQAAPAAPRPDSAEPPRRRKPSGAANLEDILEETTLERQAAENNDNDDVPNLNALPGRAPSPGRRQPPAKSREDQILDDLEEQYGNDRWWPYFVKWELALRASPQLEQEMDKFVGGLGSRGSRLDPLWYAREWMQWDNFVRANVDSMPSLQRILQTGQDRNDMVRDYVDVDLEPDAMVQLVNPPPPVIPAANMDTDDDDRLAPLGVPQDGPENVGPFGDDEEENLRLNPFETVVELNPRPQPPDVFTPWSNWPIPTCPPSPRQPLPDYFMLLCRDGIRRDHVGAFGLDSLLAKVRNRRQITYKNYCIIRNPGRLNRLTFEVVDPGFNKVPNGVDYPLLIRMGFVYHTLPTENDVLPYV
jgi:hypothetical protein